jgi:hypothetical protein
MDEAERHNGQGKKPDTKGHVCDSIYTTCPEYATLWKQGLETGSGRKGMETGFLPGVMKGRITWW